MHKLPTGIVICLLMFKAGLWAEPKEVVVTTPQGQSFILEIQPSDTFLDVTEQIQEFAADHEDNSNTDEEFVFEVLVEGRRPSPYPYCNQTLLAQNTFDAKRGGPLAAPRNYHAQLAPKERGDIHYIVTTLANKSLARIMANKSSLEAAGDRIEHIHPFNFLCCVFTDEEMKVAMHNLRHKKWIWRDFVSGLKESLSNEAGRNNLNQYIGDFAERLNVKPELISNSVISGRWDELIDTLINVIPRNGDPHRYGD